MSDQLDWVDEAREPGWFGRLVASGSGGRFAGVGLVATVIGAVCFAASLMLDWQRITVARAIVVDGEPPANLTFRAGLGSIESLSLVYTVGGIVILSLAGAVLFRADQALRVRMAAAGLASGLTALLIAIAVRLPHTIFGAQSILEAIYGQLSMEQQNRLSISYQPGIFFGFAAVLAPTIGIWLASRPASRPAPSVVSTVEVARAGGPAEVAVPAAGVAGGQPSSGWRVDPRTAERANGRLTVSASQPLDLTVSPGDPLSH